MDQARPSAKLANCAEEILFLLAAHGVEFLFLNPGTDSAPLQEAMAALEVRGVAAPQVVTCSFESVALAAAQGYWQVTRRPQAVFVHVDAGTQNLGTMVHNVLRDRAGVLVLAGKTPYDVDATSAGRSHRIHWLQDVPDQAGIVRSYAKWATELTRSADTARVVGRAVQVAGGGRPGLAYLMVSRDVLMEPASPEAEQPAMRFARPVPPAIEPAALAELAGLLLAAERPVIVTSRLGRSPGGTRSLAKLAELGAIPVTGRPEAVNIATGHPMRASRSAAVALIAEADLIVTVDCDVPWVPRQVTPAPGATVVQIDDDPVKADMPLWAFPVDLAVTADGAVAVAQLAGAVERAGGVPEALAAARRRWLAEVTGRNGADPGPAARPGEGAPRVADVVAALNGALRPSDVVLEEAVSNEVEVSELMERSEPGTLLSSGGAGLGYALGAAVGVKLARPADQVVAVVGDGAFMFGVPTAALCLAAEAQAPFVTVVLNNDGYRASRLPVTALFPDGAAASGEVPGTRFARPPDFAGLARACGAHGQTVTGAADLPAAMRDALDAARNGQAAVVDVVITGQ